MAQAPIKVNVETKERIRYLAALVDTTQAEVVDRAVQEYAVRHADLIEKGIDRARSVLASGDAALAAQLLGKSLDDVQRVSGRATQNSRRCPSLTDSYQAIPPVGQTSRASKTAGEPWASSARNN